MRGVAVGAAAAVEAAKCGWVGSAEGAADAAARMREFPTDQEALRLKHKEGERDRGAT